MEISYFRTVSILFFVSILCQHSSAGVTNFTTVDLNNLTTFTASGPSPYVIDPRFTVHPIWNDAESQHDLPMGIVLLTAVRAMYDMAIDSYNGNMRQSTWSPAEIKVTIGNNNVPMPRRFGILGLELCIREVIDQNSPEGVVCELYWEANHVGRVEVSK